MWLRIGDWSSYVCSSVLLAMPGEVAPAHRHSQSALRFVLEGRGAHTAVDGERTVMEPGDFVITPSMTWHDHGNTVDAPMTWLDGLDLPVLHFFDAPFVERHAEAAQPLDRPHGESPARYGPNPLAIPRAGTR